MAVSGLPVLSTQHERIERAKKMLAYLKEAYPKPETELKYKTPIQLVVAVMMSAQCTDKKVNTVNETLYKKYKTVDDFANEEPEVLSDQMSSITFHRAKSKAIVATARMLRDTFNGKIPKSEKELVTLPGIAYKTAHVVLGELYNIWEGIPTDTHVRRFALRFDLTKNTDLLKISKDLEELIPKEDWQYVNNGLVLYGRYICPARPHECLEHSLTKIWPLAADRWPKAK